MYFQCRVRSRNLYGMSGYSNTVCFPDPEACSSSSDSVAVGQTDMWYNHHQSRKDVTYNMRVTGAFKDPLDRQMMERIQIQNFRGPVLMNRRSEMGGVRVERMQYRRWGGE